MPWRHKGSGGISPPFLTSVLDGGEWWASRPCRSKPGERAPDTHWIGGWVGPRVGLDAVGKRKILHCWEANPGRPARSPSLYRLSYPEYVCVCVCVCVRGRVKHIWSSLITGYWRKGETDERINSRRRRFLYALRRTRLYGDEATVETDRVCTVYLIRFPSNQITERGREEAKWRVTRVLYYKQD
jgi:hypothetical protein